MTKEVRKLNRALRIKYVTGIKKSANRLNNKFDTAKERINQLEDSSELFNCYCSKKFIY